MVPLPEDIKVKRNKAAERLLVDKSRAWIESGERTPGWHASDMLDPRQAFWSRMSPQTLPDRLVNIFLIGKVLHAFVLGAVDGAVDINASDEGSFTSDDLGITFSPDKVLDGKVRELKTSRSFKEPDSVEDLAMYIEQMLVYMAATDTTSAQLWILFLNLRDEEGKTSPQFRGYDVDITPEQLEATKAFIRQTRADLDKAIETQDWRHLDLCREFKCGARNCEWYDKCRPEGRFGEPRWDGSVSKAPKVPRAKKA